MFSTLTVDGDAPLDDVICNQNWQVNQQGTDLSLRINENCEL